tara:strand:- start:5235 stop:5774 length:540 start_codon:yes stop_codon:yes gene_type:complete
MFIFFLIVSILFFTPSIAHADQYESIRTLPEIKVSVERNIENTSVHFHARNNEDISTMITLVENSIKILPKFFENSSSQACRDLEIHIYEIPRSILNDRSIMSFLNWRSWNDQDILGSYDSTYHPNGIGFIFVTRDRGQQVLKDTIVHEIAHYWQDSRCIALTEESAYRFEQYYESVFN